MSRSKARNRRFMRLRTTALPIRLVTVMPKRNPAPSLPRASKTKPGLETLMPRLAARNSARWVNTRGANAPAGCGRASGPARSPFRQKASCDRVRGARAAHCGHQPSRCANGNHGGACGRAGWAGKCASSQTSKSMARQIARTTKRAARQGDRSRAGADMRLGDQSQGIGGNRQGKIIEKARACGTKRAWQHRATMYPYQI